MSDDILIFRTSVATRNDIGRIEILFTQFCSKNQSLLEQKTIGLFICCMNKEQETEELNKAFPEYLQILTIPKAILGGEFQFDKMNFIERFLTKKIAKINFSVSRLRHDNITEFVEKCRLKATVE